MKLGGTRQAIHDALSWGWLQKQSGLTDFLTYLTEIDKSQRPSNAPVDTVEAAYICAAVDALAQHLSGWLRFAYGTAESDLIQASLASKLRFDLFSVSNAKKHARLLSVSSLSLEDYRLRLWQLKELPVALYCEKIDVQQPNFYRDGWGDKKDVCLDRIKVWDHEGVGQVSRVVKALRGERDEDDPQTAAQLIEAIANDK